MKKILRITLRIIGFISLLVVIINAWIISSTQDQIYDKIEDIPTNEVGLVLGTSNRLMSGDSNKFFHQRIAVAARLYKSGKVKRLIVSGDNGTPYYNEPRIMKNALIYAGVPADRIDMDYAGFRTLDSMIRCKLVFGNNDITVITQTFHSYRALFIGNYHDMNAVALVTEELPLGFRLGVEVRELIARTVAVWDLFIMNKRPKFLGKQESATC